MNKTTLYFIFLCLSCLLLITSCGDTFNTSKDSSSSSLTSGQCGCTASYMPVCGINNITYDNICIANCFKVTQTVQGNCICSNRPVCGDDGNTYTECDAQSAIRNGYISRIVKYADCRSGSY